MDLKTVAIALYEPFELNEIKCKPQTVKGNRALAVFYIDSRLVMDRLDDVLGVMGWRDHYDVQPDGSVVCTLSLKLGEEWISKTDVGSPSEQPDSGDRLKAAFSDALKRAAVKFGIGRYLYRLPLIWADYDPVKRHFIRVPELPPWAKPKLAIDRKQPAPYASADAEPITLTPAAAPAALPPAEPAPAPAQPKSRPPETISDLWLRMGRATPESGTQLFDWLCKIDAELIRLLGDRYHIGDVVRGVAEYLKLSGFGAVEFQHTREAAIGWKQAAEYVKRCEVGAK